MFVYCAGFAWADGAVERGLVVMVAWRVFWGDATGEDLNVVVWGLAVMGGRSGVTHD